MIAANTQEKRALGVFLSQKEAEQAINELKASGFPMEKFSIIAKDADKVEQVDEALLSDRIGNQNVNTSTGAVADTLSASTWGSVLVGLGSLAIPGLEPAIAAGSVGVALATAIGGVAVGATATNNLIKAGSSRILARDYGFAVTGITISPQQVQRAQQLTSQELDVQFLVNIETC